MGLWPLRFWGNQADFLGFRKLQKSCLVVEDRKSPKAPQPVQLGLCELGLCELEPCGLEPCGLEPGPAARGFQELGVGLGSALELEKIAPPQPESIRFQ